MATVNFFDNEAELGSEEDDEDFGEDGDGGNPRGPSNGNMDDSSEEEEDDDEAALRAVSLAAQIRIWPPKTDSVPR